MLKAQKIKIKGISHKWMNEVTAHIYLDVADLSQRYYSLKGDEHMALEVLSKIYQDNNKVFAHHGPKDKFNFTCTKGQAWFLVHFYGTKKSVMMQPSMQWLIGQLHQKTV